MERNIIRIFKRNNYVHLAIQSMFILWTVKYVTASLHEIGHGIGGWLAGSKFMGFYLAVFGGGNAFISGPRSGWQGLLTSAAGPGVDLLLGSTILFVILPRVKKYGANVFWLMAAITTLLFFWGYMLMDGFGFSGGDFYNISRNLGLNRLAVGVIGLLAVIGFAYLLSRHIFRTFFPYFLLNSFWRRFGVLFLFLGLPFIVYFIVIYFLDPGQDLMDTVMQSLMAPVIIGLLSVFPQKSGIFFRALPRQPLWIGVVFFAAACVVWLSLFGPTLQQAKGILWTVPEEKTVSACNIIVSIKDDFSARVDFLMRSQSRYLYWEKTKTQPPVWPVYEKFVEKNLPLMLGVTDYQVIEKTHELDSSFYLNHRTRNNGARRISLAVNLEETVAETEEKTYALEIIDFWKMSQGYLDKLQINLEDNLKFVDYKLTPHDARNPELFEDQKMIWENPDTKGPEKVRLIMTW